VRALKPYFGSFLSPAGRFGEELTNQEKWKRRD
jgi:hypothetical protein